METQTRNHPLHDFGLANIPVKAEQRDEQERPTGGSSVKKHLSESKRRIHGNIEATRISLPNQVSPM